MSTSAKQLAANRRNAKHSTGPKTPEGKARSSKNATKHGLLSQHAVITTGDEKSGCIVESQADFDLHLENLRESYKPKAYGEELLVQQIAVCYWKIARLTRIDQRLFNDALDPSFNHENLDRQTFFSLQRYERGLQHTLDRTLANLAHDQKARREETAREAEKEPAVDVAALAESRRQAFARQQEEEAHAKSLVYDYATRKFISRPPLDESPYPRSPSTS
jgi:hypothetical protein